MAITLSCDTGGEGVPSSALRNLRPVPTAEGEDNAGAMAGLIVKDGLILAGSCVRRGPRLL